MIACGGGDARGWLQILFKKIHELPAALLDYEGIRNHFASSHNSSCPNFELLNYCYNNRSNPELSFLFKEIDEDDISKILDSLSSSAVGYDGISLLMFKMCCPFLLPYLRHIINHCITKSIFPDCWKVIDYSIGEGK